MANWTPEQKDAIIKDGSNIIVSAGAGSGKTAVLSERVIEILKKGVHVNELLILTFTRAAADEMKDRIRNKIKENPSLNNELAYLDSSYITTFDSYSLSVLKKYHYLLNISDNIKVTDDSICEIKNREIFDQVFLEMYESKDANFYKLIDKYCIKNDYVLKENIYSISKRIDTFLDRDEYLNNIINDFYNGSTLTNFIDDLNIIINNKKRIVELEFENLSRHFDEDYSCKIGLLIRPLINISDFQQLGNYCGLSLPNVPRGSSDEAKSAKESLKKAIDDLLGFSKYSSIELLKTQFEVNKNVVVTIVNILLKYYERLDDYKKKNNIYTFSDIAKKSIGLLKDNEIVRNEIKYSFKEIMIDEYQDTNDIQECFISMIDNNNVYMVGDIKQSIYRFRGSNPSIFKNKYDWYSKNVGGIKIDLIKNFRSRFEVLDSINRLFDLLMDNDIGGANYIESHEMVYGNKKYDVNKVDGFDYDMEILEYNMEDRKDFSKTEVEIFTIANDIKNKIKSNLKVFDKKKECLRNINYSDFVIILDRSKHFSLYKKIFEYMDIPLEILKDGKLNENIDLLLIKNIIEFIYLINNKIYDINLKYTFMSIGRSFLYEYSDDYLFDVITNNKIYETKLYRDFIDISNYNSKTAFEMLIDILNITNYYNKLYKIGDYENINVRLETISNLANSMNDSGMSFVDLKDYINDILEQKIDIKYTMFNNSGDSVKILTIHKSKGLEYPICYFADLDQEFNMSDIKNKFIVSRDYGIITPLVDIDNDDSFIKEIYKNKFLADEISEKIRLFYVALTRAREKIIIVVPESGVVQYEKNMSGSLEKIRRLNYRSLGDLIYSTKYYLKKYFKNIKIEELGLTKNYLYNKDLNVIIENDHVKKLNVSDLIINSKRRVSNHFSKNSLSLKSKQEIDYMDFGTYIHELLEYCNIKNPRLDLIKDKFIREKMEEFINNPLIKDSNGIYYHEYEFVYDDDNNILHGVIDLLIEEEDKIVIIDYKLKNVMDDAYKNQINGYKKYIQTKCNKLIVAYLYSIMDGQFFEV